MKRDTYIIIDIITMLNAWLLPRAKNYQCCNIHVQLLYKDVAMQKYTNTHYTFRELKRDKKGYKMTKTLNLTMPDIHLIKLNKYMYDKHIRTAAFGS